MKHIILLFAIAAFSSNVSAQAFYDAPYVHEGASFRFTIPPGYDEIDTGTEEFQMFSSNPNIMMDMEDESNISDFIMIGVTENDNENMDLIFEELLEESGVSSNSEFEISTFLTNSNKEFQTLKGPLDFFTASKTPTMIGVTEFHEVLTIVVIVDGDDGHTIAPSLLEAMLRSYAEVETDRENAFFPYHEEMLESDPSFINDQFYTDLSYDYINLFPDLTWETENASRYWEEDWREDYPELLLAFMFTQIEGAEAYAGIKIFSGGDEDYTSGLKKLTALQKVFPSHHIEGLTNEETTVSGDNYSFQKYEVNSGAFEFTRQILYVTKIQGETIFVLGYMTDEPTEALETELEKVVKTLEYDE